jgi:hypothetical protein
VQAVILLWRPSPWLLWRARSLAPALLWTHRFGWLLLAVQSCFFDHWESSGVKQLYYHYVLRAVTTPFEDKTEATRRLYAHMRHPHLLAALLLLWTVPHMTADRLVLALCVPLALVARSALDLDDVTYVRAQLLQRYHRAVERSNPWLRARLL